MQSTNLTAASYADEAFLFLEQEIGLLTVDEHLFLCSTCCMCDATFNASLACVIRPAIWVVYRSRSAATARPQQADRGLPTGRGNEVSSILRCARDICEESLG
jgi:hypothetical protein